MCEFSQLHKFRILKKAESVLADHSHPLSEAFVLLLSGHSYSLPRWRANRYENSFVITAIGVLNVQKCVADCMHCFACVVLAAGCTTIYPLGLIMITLNLEPQCVSGILLPEQVSKFSPVASKLWRQPPPDFWFHSLNKLISFKEDF